MMRTILILCISLSSICAHAQCYPDRHNTSWNEGWVSCEERQSPNGARGDGHWIMYDFGHAYTLGEMKVWNYNAPDWLDFGIRQMAVDFSIDGVTWKAMGNYVVDRASGSSRYEGHDLTNFQGDTAKYVLLTGINNYGGNCLGLSEVKFKVVDKVSETFTMADNHCFKVSLYPNPHAEQFSFNLITSCSGDVQYALYDHTGKLVLQGRSDSGTSDVQLVVATTGISAGLYHLVVYQGKNVGRYPVVKMRQ